MKETVINLTPHDITVYKNKDVITIPSSGVVRLEESVFKENTPFKFDIVRKTYTGISVKVTKEIPKAESYLIIVSSIVLDALDKKCYKHYIDIILEELYMPANAVVLFAAPDTGQSAVRDDKGCIIGVRRFYIL